MSRSRQLPDSLLRELKVSKTVPLLGGDSASSYRLETPEGPLFAKTMPRPEQGVLPLEAAGLEALRAVAPESVGVPQVMHVADDALVLSWIDEGPVRLNAQTEAEFGKGLAQIHSVPFDHFGGLSPELPNIIGSSPVDMSATDDWGTFLFHRRIEPLVRTAVDQGAVDPTLSVIMDRLESRQQELAGPEEHPSLLHGDLWAGNRVIDRTGRSWLIDPHAFYGHREYDLAMMQLFGGFGEECFDAYDHEYPIGDGWQDRVPWYQMAPLLVHAIRFGGGYGSAVMRAVRHYV